MFVFQAIYDRQINKQGMSDRVVDELNPQNCMTRNQVDALIHYQVMTHSVKRA